MQTASWNVTPRSGFSPSNTRRSANTSRSAGISSRAATASATMLARAFGRLNRRVAHHQRDAARVRPEIDRRQIGVAGDGAHIERIDAEHLRHDRHQHIVRALADFRGAAEHRHAAAAIELQLHAGVRQVIPVDREVPAPDRYDEQASPMPRPSGSLRNFSRHPSDRRRAGCTRRARWCRCAGNWRSRYPPARSMPSRRSAGSFCRPSAILSSCTSCPKRDCGVPCPRFGPHGGLLVNTRQPRKRYRGMS